MSSPADSTSGPQHIWKDKDPTKFRDNPPVRSGPYMLDKAIQSQKMFVWKKNPDYWAKDRLDPKPEYVIFQSTAKQADSAALAFERCEFDWARSTRSTPSSCGPRATRR